MRRKLLGTASNLVTRTRVYLADGAVEVDQIEGYSGIRKRVLFDEVLLVTLDRRRRLQSVVLWAALGAMFTAPGLLAAVNVPAGAGTTAALVIAAICGTPFLIGLLAHLALGVDHVTIFGKRTSAQMRFALRKRRAREVFALVRDRVHEAQEAGT
jgi:hypothetical protein